MNKGIIQDEEKRRRGKVGNITGSGHISTFGKDDGTVKEAARAD